MGRIQWMGEAKTGIKPMVEIECRGEPCVRPRTKTSIEPMVENILQSWQQTFRHEYQVFLEKIFASCDVYAHASQT